MNPPALPVTWRPHRTRFVAYGFAALIMIGAVVMALAMAEPWTWLDRLFLVLFAGLVAGILHLLARVRVTADERGLTIVNALRTHRRTWPEIIDVGMVPGEPWPKIDFSDGTSVGVMGIQGSEKANSARALAELDALIRDHSDSKDI
ncbi:PH domain-containing protein [Nonomuraea soli]|uniref:Low molecular weight protein antigen 6 PH domain-containing protein n=1 Tax=Nonomuraea soli TaxID=1032476 RepID=A0A7W0CER6_9ACTN|nr:PH domain-containing protein [Nonomuraea soli]MBA2889655.1 hypothetical protein [Nonomuraea soli]